MVPAIRWIGERDGQIELADGSGEVRTLDRLGDTVVALGELVEQRHEGVAALSAYAICIASRGIVEPRFVRQILGKAYPFVLGVDPASRVIYETVTRMRELSESLVDLDGDALRDRLLAEAHSIQRENGG